MKVIVTSAAVTAALLLSLEHGLAQRSSSPRTATPRTATPRDTSAPAGRAQRPRTPSARVAALRITATNSADLRTWDSYVTQRLGTGELRARSVDRDPAMPQRTVERLQAYHHGVPVWGSEVVRDSQAGVPVAIFGEMAADFAIETQPRLTLGEAERRLLALGGADATLLKAVELTIVRHETREPFLAYTGVVSGHGEVNRVFLDANDGSELMRYTEIQTQAATGSGRGVLGAVPDELLMDPISRDFPDAEAARARYHAYLTTRLAEPRAFVKEAINARATRAAEPPRRRPARGWK